MKKSLPIFVALVGLLLVSCSNSGLPQGKNRDENRPQNMGSGSLRPEFGSEGERGPKFGSGSERSNFGSGQMRGPRPEWRGRQNTESGATLSEESAVSEIITQ